MGKCKAKHYKDNTMIFHSPIICWGFGESQPKCDYLKGCIKDNKDKISTRKYNAIMKKYF